VITVKIAVLSDIHGNVPALDAVLDDIAGWNPDEVIVNGDLVSRGPNSLECLRLLEKRVPASRRLAGNHEEYVLACADHPPSSGDPDYDLHRFALWTARRLGAAVDVLRGLENHVDLTGLEGGSSLHVTHGSRLGNRSGVAPETSDEELALRLGDARDLFVGSHTHRPMIRHFNGNLVVNTGSVGQPFDGDPRAAYGRLTFTRGRWRAEIARVAYNRSRAEQDFADSGFVDECGPLARLILREFIECRMLVGPWMKVYREAVRSRQLTVTEAVEEYLASL
jgi:predicted phosphodiesterase